VVVQPHLAGGGATAVSFYVNSATGNDASAVLGTAPYKTITKAVQMASAVALTSGANINVASGVYSAATGEVFPIMLTNGMNIVGTGIADVEGSGNFTVGEGDQMGNIISTTFAASSPSATTNINVSITGITASSVAGAPTVVSAVGTNLTLSNNTFTFPVNGSNYPVWIMASSVAAISNNTITGWVAIDSSDFGTKMKLRGNKLDGGFTVCTADFSAIPSQLDLGTAADPGNNTIKRSGGGTAGLNSFNPYASAVVITAVGNTWPASGVQGADANAHYAASSVVGGTAAATSGPNYNVVPTAGIQF